LKQLLFNSLRGFILFRLAAKPCAHCHTVLTVLWWCWCVTDGCCCVMFVCRWFEAESLEVWLASWLNRGCR